MCYISSHLASTTDTPSLSFIFFILILRPPISTLFPYTTLFRSDHAFRIADAHEVARLARRKRGGCVRRRGDRKSTRLNSSHVSISYAVFCLKKKIDLKQANVQGVAMSNSLSIPREASDVRK